MTSKTELGGKSSKHLSSSSTKVSRKSLHLLKQDCLGKISSLVNVMFSIPTTGKEKSSCRSYLQVTFLL